MADFSISGSLDPRQILEGLKAVERGAEATGQRVGDNLQRGVAQVAAQIPSSLARALRSAEGSAASSGAAIGSGLADGIARQLGSTIPTALSKALSSGTGSAARVGQQVGSDLASGASRQIGDAIPAALQKAIAAGGASAAGAGQRIGGELGAGIGVQLQGTVPSALQKALESGGSGAASSGQQVGATFTGAVGTAVSGKIPPVLERALNAGAASGEKAGQQLGSSLAGGTSDSLQRVLPTGLSKAVEKAGETVRGSGASIGSGLGTGITTSLEGTLPAGFRRVFIQGQEQAGREGRGIGQTLGEGIGSGLEGNRALFQSVIVQAQKAARDVGLVFNTVKLRFERASGEIVPQAELDKLRALNPALDAAANGLARFSGATRQGAAGLEPIAAGMGNVTRQGGLMEAAVGGVAFSLANTFTNAAFGAVNAIQGLVAGFAALDTEIRKAATAAGEQGGYERLYKSIDAVGIEAAGTQLQVAQLATSLVRAGYTVTEVEKAMPGIVRGAEATGTAFEQMGSIVGNTLRGFGLQVSETGRVVDVLVKAANASNANVEGLGYTFQYAAPVAKALKINLEDLAATAGLMANAGIDASVAGTGLRFGLQRLQKAASGATGESLGLSKAQNQLTRAMKRLGAEVTTAQGTLKPLDQVFIALKRSLEGLEVSAQIELASAIFGDEAGSKFLSVTNQSEEAIRKMFAEIRSSQGAADQARAGMQGFQLALMQVEGTLGALANTFGQVVSASLTPFISAANVALGVLVALPAPVKQLVAALALLAGAYVGAKLSAVAFSRALQQPIVAGAIKEVQVLLRFLRVTFKRDLALAIAQWKTWQVALNKGNTAGAVQGLQQIGQGLKNLNAAQAVAGFKQLGVAIQAIAAQAKAALAVQLAQAVAGLRAGLTNASNSAAVFGTSMRNAATASAAAEAGLSGVALLLQRGMTTGAKGAATASTGLSKALAGLAGVTKAGAVAGLKGLVSSLGAATVAAGPLVVALAAIVPAVVGYNQAMGQSRQVTATVGETVSKFGDQLKSTGTSFTDFGKQGGPLQELMNGISKQFEDAGEAISKIPYVGGLAKAALDALTETVKLLTGIKFIEWGRDAINIIKAMYAEAENNQAMIEAGDQFEQYQEQVDKASERAGRFIARLRELNSVPATSVQAFSSALNDNRRNLESSITASKNLAAQLKQLATAAEGNNQPELVAYYNNLAAAASNQVVISQKQLAVLDAEAEKRGLVKSKLDAQAISAAALAQQLTALNGVIASIGGDAQLGQSLLGYAQAMADLEQSRFSITRARGDYELQQAQETLNKELEAAKLRGASDQQVQRLRIEGEKGLEAIRARNRQLEAQSLTARFQALQQQQAIEQALLGITQQKARLEADQGVNQAKIQLLEAERALKEAIGKKDQEQITLATGKVLAQKEAVRLAEANVTLVGRLQPLEQLIAAAKGETAQNALKAEAASKGMESSLSNTASNSSTISQAMAGASVELRRAADGSWQLVSGTQEAATAAGQAAGQAGALSSAYGAVAQQSQQVSSATQAAAADTAQTATAAADAAKGMEGTAKAAGAAADSAGQVGTSAKSSADKAKALESALRQSAAGATTVASAQMASNLSRASGSAGGLRNAMVQAATAARDFYSWLAKASGLPGSRWTGGPVAGGQTVRINDGPAGRSLGQESFLTTTGQLSLINRPANSLWTAPAPGIVIPAGVTESLKAQGAFNSGGKAIASGRQLIRGRSGERDMAGNLARQARAIGKLQESVDRLVEKDWNVRLQVRSDAHGSDYLNTLNRML